MSLTSLSSWASTSSSRRIQAPSRRGGAKSLTFQLRLLERELEMIEAIRIDELEEIDNWLKESKQVILRGEEERFRRENQFKCEALKEYNNRLIENLMQQNDELRSENELLLKQLQEEERVAKKLQAESQLYETMIGKAKICTQEMEGSVDDLASLIPLFHQSALELEDEVHFYQECSQIEYRNKVTVQELTSKIIDRLNASFNSSSQSSFDELGLTGELRNVASFTIDANICQPVARTA
jgi:hypothetical protein